MPRSLKKGVKGRQRAMPFAWSCDGKVGFESFQHADGVIHRRTKTRRARQAYHCHHCGKWHLGTDPAGRRKLDALELRKARTKDE